MFSAEWIVEWDKLNSKLDIININSMSESFKGVIKDLNLKDAIKLGESLAKMYPSSYSQWNELKAIAKSLDNNPPQSEIESWFQLGDTIIKSHEFMEYKDNWEELVSSSQPINLMLKYPKLFSSINLQILYERLLTKDSDSLFPFHKELMESLSSNLSKEKYKPFLKDLLKVYLQYQGSDFLLNITQDEFSFLASDFQTNIKEEIRLKIISLLEAESSNITIEYNGLILYGKFYPLKVDQSILSLIRSGKLNRNEIQIYLSLFSKNSKLFFEPIQNTINRNLNLFQKTVVQQELLSIYEMFSIDQKNNILQVGTKILIGSKAAEINTLIENKINISRLKFSAYIDDPRTGQIDINIDNTEENKNKLENAGLAAITYYYPAIGLAIKLGQNLWNSMLDAHNLNKKTEEIKNNEAKILDLSDKIRSANIQKTIAQFEIELSELRGKGAQLCVDASNRIIERYKEHSTQNERELEIYLRLFFYWAEILRMDYSLLNKATQFWHNSSIGDLVLGDINNLRLSSDPNIKLYQWFDLSLAGQKSSIDSLFHQWEGINTILSANTDLIKFGRTGEIQVSNSQDYYLSKSFPGEYEKLLNWKNSNSDETLTLTLEFTPEIVNLHESDLKAFDQRIIDLRVDGISEDETIFSLSGHIKNSGYYLIDKQSGRTSETLEKKGNFLRQFSSIGGQSINFSNINSYKKRWDYEGIQSLNSYEGYGLFSTWIITITKSEQNIINDIKFQFAFQHSFSKNTPPKQAAYTSVVIYKGRDIASHIVSRRDYEKLGINTKEELETLLKDLIKRNIIFDYKIERDEYVPSSY